MKKYATLITFGFIVWLGIACGKSDKTAGKTDNASCFDTESIPHTANEDMGISENSATQTENASSKGTDSSINSFEPKEEKSVLTPAKRALVIGIGEQMDKNWAKINGDKDVPFVKEMLVNAGYKDIHTLVNKQATKASILSGFKSLTNRCHIGDVVYVHFSGHGQQVTDVNGDEEDGFDESWIPYDAYLKYGKEDKGEKHLIDDEIYMLLTAIRKNIGEKGKLLVVVDACHSGDSSRGDDLDETVRGVYDKFVIPTTKKVKTTKATEQWLTLSACEDYQLNQELKSPQVGKLTYTLYMLSKNGDLSKKGIVNYMAKLRSRLPQDPVQTGDEVNQKISDFLR